MNTYIETIDEIQKIEEVIIKDSKLKRCCNSSLEIFKNLFKISKKSKTLLQTSVAQTLAPSEEEVRAPTNVLI